MAIPYRLRKSRKKPCYRVKNRTTKRVFSKCTTKEKGKRQVGYLTTFLRNKLGDERFNELVLTRD
jgi:hypothetical protein